MRDAMRDDRARTSVSRLSDNGLLEINRQRLKKALQLRTYRPCPTCSGAGSIASSELIALNLLRRVETRAVTGQLGSVRIELHPELADAIQNERRQELAALEREFDIDIEIIAATGLHRAEERIDWRPRTKAERAEGPAVSAADLGEGMGGRRKSEPQQAREEAPEDGQGEAPPDKDKPRKRRRGGRRRKKSAEPAEAQSTDAPEPAAEDSTQEAAAGGDEPSPAKKKSRRRRPRRSRKKTTGQNPNSDPPADSATDTDGGATNVDNGSDPYVY
jgi:ribonuclease E